MQRLLVALLAAVDAAIAAAVGLAVLLAPLTLLWTLALGGAADWGALWPVAGTLWQFGHGVPLDIMISDDILIAAGIAPQAANFTLSLTPMAFFFFTLFFAARSGVRAARSGSWLVGSVVGSAVFAAIVAGVAVTAHTDAARTALWLGILIPSCIYLVGALAGAVWYAWREGDGGVVDRVHDLVDGWGDWGPVLAESIRGAAVALVALTGVAGLAVALMVVLRGGDVIALFESARVDATGVSVITLAHLMYLPTLLVWAVAWIAGPGFAVGIGTAVSPAGTQLGVVPGIPVLGLLPEVNSFWMLIVVLVPVGTGAVAGWMVRSRLVWEGTALRIAPRAAIAGGIALLTAGSIAVAGVLASGSIGPGRLAVVGPDPAVMALAVGGEVLVGAAILLLAPRHRDELAEERTDRWVAEMGTFPTMDAPPIPVETASAARPETAVMPGDTVPLDELGPLGDGDTAAPR